MTARERCLNILHYKRADRMPAVHFGYWQELLDEWAEQGHISAELAKRAGADGSDAQKELDKIIGWDCVWGHSVNIHTGLYPYFERKVLETLPDGTQRVQTGTGVIERIKPGIASIPSEDDYLLKDREAFEKFYRSRMQYTPERYNTTYFETFNETRDKTVPIGIGLGSVMGHIRDICTVVGMSYLMYDEDEDLFADIVDTYAEMQYKCAEVTLATGAQFDFGHYWEDICFKNGPLLSPEIFDCDGVTEKLIGTWLENGVNVLFPNEVGVWGDQFEPARKKYGESLLGVGGMDKTALRKDRAAVDAEIERMKRLASMGGFIPCPDHRLMPGTKFELVQYYAEEIKKIKV